MFKLEIYLVDFQMLVSNKCQKKLLSREAWGISHGELALFIYPLQKLMEAYLYTMIYKSPSAHFMLKPGLSNVSSFQGVGPGYVPVFASHDQSTP